MVYLFISAYLFVAICCIGGLLIATHQALRNAGPIEARDPPRLDTRQSQVISYDQIFRQLPRRRMEPANSGRRL